MADKFSKTVTTAGIDESLKDESFLVESAFIQAKTTNTSNIYLGPGSITNDESDGAVVLTPGQGFSLPDDANRGKYDLSKWHIDAAVSGEGVNVIVQGEE